MRRDERIAVVVLLGCLLTAGWLMAGQDVPDQPQVAQAQVPSACPGSHTECFEQVEVACKTRKSQASMSAFSKKTGACSGQCANGSKVTLPCTRTGGPIIEVDEIAFDLGPVGRALEAHFALLAKVERCENMPR